MEGVPGRASGCLLGSPQPNRPRRPGAALQMVRRNRAQGVGPRARRRPAAARPRRQRIPQERPRVMIPKLTRAYVLAICVTVWAGAVLGDIWLWRLIYG